MTDDATVEHILPRAGGPDWGLFSNPAMRADVANLIGNLTLISYDQNKEADAKGYAEKRKLYTSFRGNPPIHALTRDIESISSWTMDAIEARQERLISRLCADWGLVPDPYHDA